MRLHHVGIAVRDVAKEHSQYAERLGYQVRSAVIHDPVQTAYVCFLALPGDPVYLELVSPDGPESKLAGAVKRGGGLNHVCYAVQDIEQACARMRKAGMFPLQEPVAAAAFPGRRIAWMMGRDRMPVELVDAGEDRWDLPEPGGAGA